MMKVLVVSPHDSHLLYFSYAGPDSGCHAHRSGAPSAMHHIWLLILAGQQIYYGQLLYASDSGVVVTDRRDMERIPSSMPMNTWV